MRRLYGRQHTRRTREARASAFAQGVTTDSSRRRQTDMAAGYERDARKLCLGVSAPADATTSFARWTRYAICHASSSLAEGFANTPKKLTRCSAGLKLRDNAGFDSLI